MGIVRLMFVSSISNKTALHNNQKALETLCNVISRNRFHEILALYDCANEVILSAVELSSHPATNDVHIIRGTSDAAAAVSTGLIIIIIIIIDPLTMSCIDFLYFH